MNSTGRRLAGKTALITAAAQGIGRAIALAFSAEGASVWATDINGIKLQELEGEPSISIRTLDVTDPDEVVSVVNEVGAVDLLVNCAGYVHMGNILNCSDEDWDRSFDINVKGMFMVTREMLPAMLDAGGGAIVNVASVASSIKGVNDRCAYSASKAAVIGFTKSIAADYINQGVRCNAVCPGTVDTPSLGDRIRAAGGDEAKVREYYVDRQPMGRLGNAEEIAQACVYLASDDAEFMTGTEFVIDGGMVL
ncbi:MAG: NAD(P)-dependent oxidoreductase [Alphaproteobacteria bacterium]|nr:NAD(P)-dependent oxidoreductase [Alphaproteobacteria bacterium]|tara:strand:- start:793 stop:1545 length:753 start_codon:yes stop_codon:yes gene_type:complete